MDRVVVLGGSRGLPPERGCVVASFAEWGGPRSGALGCYQELRILQLFG